MKLEDQVCSLELSKRLKEWGMKQNGYFQWFSVKGDREKDCYVSHYGDEGGYGYAICSAFTVSELGEMLPRRVLGSIFVGGYLNRGWVIQYRFHNTIIREEYDKKESDARAKMLIYLLENKLLKEVG